MYKRQPLYVHSVSNVAALYRRLIAAHGLSADKLDLKLLGGDTVRIVVRQLEDHRLVEAFFYRLITCNIIPFPPDESTPCL